MKKITTKKLRKLTHKQQVCFAIFCAEQVCHLPCDKTRKPALKAIETTKLWLEGRASKEDCRIAANATTAAYAAYAAYAANATTAAYAAAAYAAAAANAAAHAAAHAGKKEKEVVEAQWAFYKELLEFDEIFEREVL